MFRICPNNYDEVFCESYERLLTVDYFHKNSLLQMLGNILDMPLGVFIVESEREFLNSDAKVLGASNPINNQKQ